MTDQKTQAQDDGSLQIVEVQIENVLGIRRASFLPNSGASILYGENGEGKTSLLSAIQAGFKGLPSELVTIGEDQARVLLKLQGAHSSFTVERKRTASGQKLDVRDDRGTRIERPSKWLDGIIGDFSLDPGRFATVKGEEQVRMFTDAFPVELMGSEVDEIAGEFRIKVDGRNGFVVLREIEERLEEKRRAAGVAKRQAEAVAEEAKPADVTLKDPNPAIEEQRREVEDAVARVRGVETANDAVKSRNAQRNSLRQAIGEAREEGVGIDRYIDQEHARIDEEIARLERRKEEISERGSAKKDELLKRIEASEAALEDLGPDEATMTADEAEQALATAREALEGLERRAEDFRRIKVWEQKTAEAEERKAEWDEIDRVLNETVRQKWVRSLWRQVPLAVEGLELGSDSKGKPSLVIAETGPDGKTIQVPLSQVNTAKRLQVGVKIAAALNRDFPVKVLAADDAEHLTRKNREELARAAEEAGFQLLLLVASDEEDVPEGGLLMRDGIVEHRD